MLDQHMIDKRINHVKTHGDCAQDVHDLAALLYVKAHLNDADNESDDSHALSREKAEAWVQSMRGNDPAVPHGGKWTMEQLKPVAQKYGVPTEGERFFEFYAVMNALYSDYYSVAKKYNQLTPDFFADMSMAFVNDKDAAPGKVARYYKYIAEK